MSPDVVTYRPSSSGIEDFLPVLTWSGTAAGASDDYSRDSASQLDPRTTAELSPSSLRHALLEGLVNEAQAELRRYLSFGSGWDGYTGRVFSKRLVHVASQLVRVAFRYFDDAGVLPLEITPGPASDGSLDIEIATAHRRVIFTLYPELRQVEIYRCSPHIRQTLEPAELGEASVVRQLDWLVS